VNALIRDRDTVLGTHTRRRVRAEHPRGAGGVPGLRLARRDLGPLRPRLRGPQRRRPPGSDRAQRPARGRGYTYGAKRHRQDRRPRDDPGRAAVTAPRRRDRACTRGPSMATRVAAQTPPTGVATGNAAPAVAPPSARCDRPIAAMPVAAGGPNRCAQAGWVAQSWLVVAIAATTSSSSGVRGP
jgi:hypothetical protein